jgi:hypothetical protein
VPLLGFRFCWALADGIPVPCIVMDMANEYFMKKGIAKMYVHSQAGLCATSA